MVFVLPWRLSNMAVPGHPCAKVSGDCCQYVGQVILVILGTVVALQITINTLYMLLPRLRQMIGSCCNLRIRPQISKNVTRLPDIPRALKVPVPPEEDKPAEKCPETPKVLDGRPEVEEEGGEEEEGEVAEEEGVELCAPAWPPYPPCTPAGEGTPRRLPPYYCCCLSRLSHRSWAEARGAGWSPSPPSPPSRRSAYSSPPSHRCPTPEGVGEGVPADARGSRPRTEEQEEAPSSRRQQQQRQQHCRHPHPRHSPPDASSSSSSTSRPRPAPVNELQRTGRVVYDARARPWASEARWCRGEAAGTPGSRGRGGRE